MNAMFRSLYEKEYTRVSQCTSAQEIWEYFQVTHEGISQVKNSKIGFLTSQYEAFKREEGKTSMSSTNNLMTLLQFYKTWAKN